MKKIAALLVIAVLVVAAYSCKKNSGNNTATPQQVTLVLPSTPDQYFSQTFGSSNPDSVNYVATLGRVLFYDTHLSTNNAVSCGSCHQQAYGFADNVALSTGFQGLPTKRNTIGITQLAQFQSLFWDGREDNMQNLILRPVTNHVEMGITDASVLPGKLSALSYYTPLFVKAFGDGTITVDRISSAVSLFVQSVGLTSTTRLDLYEAGNTTVLTAQEINGKMLFDTKYNCSNCHGGAFIFGGGGGNYSGDQTFKDIGLDQNYTDLGRGEITGVASDKGTFLVPNLRNVALTAPYMHDGRFQTLEQCVDHYSNNIMPSANLDPFLRDVNGNPRQFNITASDKADIVAFLKTMTDYTTTTDPKFSNPFKVN